MCRMEFHHPLPVKDLRSLDRYGTYIRHLTYPSASSLEGQLREMLVSPSSLVLTQSDRYVPLVNHLFLADYLTCGTLMAFLTFFPFEGGFKGTILAYCDFRFRFIIMVKKGALRPPSVPMN